MTIQNIYNIFFCRQRNELLSEKINSTKTEVKESDIKLKTCTSSVGEKNDEITGLRKQFDKLVVQVNQGKEREETLNREKQSLQLQIYQQTLRAKKERVDHNQEHYTLVRRLKNAEIKAKDLFQGITDKEEKLKEMNEALQQISEERARQHQLIEKQKNEGILLKEKLAEANKQKANAEKLAQSNNKIVDIDIVEVETQIEAPDVKAKEPAQKII